LVWVVPGGAKNTARHFINKYADGCKQLPVLRLVELAAHAIIEAHAKIRTVRRLGLAMILRDGVPVLLQGFEAGTRAAIVKSGLRNSI
jgi:hypothetical protein